MEDALALAFVEDDKPNGKLVLILVLMEDALAQQASRAFVRLAIVLILVLMEDALAPEQSYCTKRHVGAVLILVLMEDALAQRLLKGYSPLLRRVLILVLMEDALAPARTSDKGR